MRRNTSRTLPLLLVLSVAALLLAGCPSGGGGGGDDTYEIIDQPLQGNFNGKVFDYNSGYAEADDETGEYHFYLYNVEPADGFQPWEAGAYLGSEYLEVLFSVPQAVGTYDLYFDLYDWSSEENQTVTLYDPIDDSLNILCDLGSIRIDSIDTVSGIIQGAIAARPSDDGSDWVNGTFAIEIEPID
ncbi:MAG TPA: hypothetical protein PLB91_04500 [Spirochaetales bacterium]|nr:hypothetical protein [Spirochaetales bacterium]HRY55330.1 hypothetical protein [Spirochaetia bacterium]HRZ64412.1 hypothetical protein [Spirochaetia bacterium]